MPYQYPRQPTGEPGKARQDVQQLWEDLWKLVEELNVQEQMEAVKDGGQQATGNRQ